MSYPKATKELVFFGVTANKVNTTENIEVAVIKGGVEPDENTEWKEPLIIEEKLCILIDGFEPAVWRIWVRATSTPEQPIVYCGKFLVE